MEDGRTVSETNVGQIWIPIEIAIVLALYARTMLKDLKTCPQAATVLVWAHEVCAQPKIFFYYSQPDS